MQQMREMSLNDPLVAQQQSPLLSEFLPFKSSFSLIDRQNNQVILLQINPSGCQIMLCSGLDSEPIGVYEDPVQSLVHVVTSSNLNVFTFSRRTKRLVRRSGYAFAQSLVQMN
jgi:DNA-binding beta-propeller fold protein YncE